MKTLILIGIVMLLSACTGNYYILVKSDNSAHIKFFYTVEDSDVPDTEVFEMTEEESIEWLAYEDTLRRFFDPTQISNLTIDESHTVFEYDIKNIDSLGFFIDPFRYFGYAVEFKKTATQFKINEVDHDLEQTEDPTGSLNFVNLNLHLEFEQEIKRTKTKVADFKVVDSCNLDLRAHIGQLVFDQTSKIIDVKLKK